jgi:hypothetical protein
VLPARVRLTLTSGSRLTGQLLRVEEGRVVLRTDVSPPEPEKVIPLAEVKSAQVSRGRHRNAGKGALIGLATGLAGGIMVGTSCEGDCAGPVFVAFGAGFVLGPVIGAFVKTERWSDIPVSSLTATSPPAKGDNALAETSPDRQMRFSIAPTIDRGVQARFSINWR